MLLSAGPSIRLWLVGLTKDKVGPQQAKELKEVVDAVAAARRPPLAVADQLSLMP